MSTQGESKSSVPLDFFGKKSAEEQSTVQERDASRVLEEADLICFSHLRWDLVFQRPQHLLSRCARERRVFYIEEPLFTAEESGDSDVPAWKISLRDGGARVLTPHLPSGLSPSEVVETLRSLLAQLLAGFEIRRFVAWYLTPKALEFSDHLQPAAIVYDCMDELSAFAGACPSLITWEKELIRRADLVFTGGQSLFEHKRHLHPSIHCFPSSIDAAHFSKGRCTTSDPADQAEIPSPRLGFFGVVDERFDIDLLAGLAHERPSWHFVIIGPVVKIDPKILPQAPNIHYLGSKRYGELPDYIAGWDAALLPFAKNEATRFISPTKTPEYLAAGKRVVSTSVKDVVRPYGDVGLVRIADTVPEFVDAAEACLREKQTEPEAEWFARVDAFLEGNSWDNTWSRMHSLVCQVLGGLGTRQAKQKSFSSKMGTKDWHRPIVIAGARGTLGQAFARVCELRDIPFRLLSRDEMDITRPESVRQRLAEINPGAVINAAGFVRVDDAELQSSACRQSNTWGASVLAEACAQRDLPFLTFSTDLVFGGQQRTPYLEDCAVDPLNVYGRTKAEAEVQVRERHPAALIIRTSAFFGPWDEHNFVSMALRHLTRYGEFCAADDVFVSPTYVPDLVHACLDLLEEGATGLWHLSNQGQASWADFARAAAKRAGIDPQSVSGKHQEDMGWRAPRPAYSVLGSRREALLPTLDNALDRYFKEVQL